MVVIVCGIVFVGGCGNNNKIEKEEANLNKGNQIGFPYEKLEGDPWHYYITTTPQRSGIIFVHFLIVS